MPCASPVIIILPESIHATTVCTLQRDSHFVPPRSRSCPSLDTFSNHLKIVSDQHRRQAHGRLIQDQQQFRLAHPSARAIVNICCSPPDIVLANWFARSFNRGNVVNAKSTPRIKRRFVVVQIRPFWVFHDGHACEYTTPFRNHDQTLFEQFPRRDAFDGFAFEENVAVFCTAASPSMP